MLDLFGSSVVGLGLQKEFPAPLCVTGSTDILIVIASIFCSGAIKSVYSPGCTKSCRILAYLRDVNEIDCLSNDFVVGKLEPAFKNIHNGDVLNSSSQNAVIVNVLESPKEYGTMILPNMGSPSSVCI